MIACGRKAEEITWAPKGNARSITSFVASGYFWRIFKRDYALVRFNGDDQCPTTFRLFAETDKPLRLNDTVHVAGYPGGTNVLHHAEGKIIGIQKDFVFYNVDTQKGVSGSPLWIEREGEAIIIGVHVSGFATGATAKRVNGRMRDEIEKWLREP